MAELKTYQGEGDESIFQEHRTVCICCGGQTKQDGNVRLKNGNNSDLYRCEVCDTQIAFSEGKVYMRAEPRRVEYVISDEYPEYNWR